VRVFKLNFIAKVLHEFAVSEKRYQKNEDVPNYFQGELTLTPVAVAMF